MIPVEGHKNLFRDEDTNAIISTDTAAYEDYLISHGTDISNFYCRTS